jgi:hypothetical protein
MSDEPLTNAAVEWFRGLLAAATERPTGPGPVTEDFYYEDRQSGGVNFGRIDAAGFGRFIASAWDVGVGAPDWSVPEVIALRDESSATMNIVLDYGNDTVVDNIACLVLDTSLRLMRRLIIFDLDDREAAIAELERLHAEFDD